MLLLFDQQKNKQTILDKLKNNLVCAFGLTKLRDNYTSSDFRVRRSVDNSELNIGFNGIKQNVHDLNNFCNQGNTISVNGDSKISTAQSKFGGASGLFDGTGDYLSIADSSDWNFESGDFTIDFWVRFTVFSNKQYFCSQWEDINNRFGFAYLYNDDGVYALQTWLTVAGVDVINGYANTVLSINTWYHIAYVYESGTMKVYLDGTNLTLSAGNWTGSPYINFGAPLEIGRRNHSTPSNLNGYLDEFRISKGIARWITNFTPPTSPYTTDSYTKLLLHMDGTNNSTVFRDDSEVVNASSGSVTTLYDQSGNGNNATQTTAANQPRTVNSGTLDNSIVYDGSNDYFEITQHTTINDLSTISICAVINAIDYGGGTFGRIIDKAKINCGVSSNDATNGVQALWISQSHAVSTGTWKSPNSSIVTGTTYFVCLTYDNSNNANDPKIYINGVEVTTTETETPSGAATSNAGDNLVIGNNAGGIRGFNGKIPLVLVLNKLLNSSEINQLYQYAKKYYGVT